MGMRRGRLVAFETTHGQTGQGGWGALPLRLLHICAPTNLKRFLLYNTTRRVLIF